MKIINRFGGRSFNFTGGIIFCAACIICFIFLTNHFDSDVIVISAKPSPGMETDLIKFDSTGHNIPLEIRATTNFMNLGSSFKIDKDTIIRIIAVGEGSDYSMNPNLFQSFDNDEVEVFFDMRNRKLPLFDINKDDRQYRILWKSLKIMGQNVDTTGVKVIEMDPTDHIYIMQIAFPWKTLGYITPAIDTRIGFDVKINDCDGGTRKASVNWHSNSEDNWENASLFGTLILKDQIFSSLDPANESLARKISDEPGFRTISERIWKEVASYPIRRISFGGLDSASDLNANFKALWDINNLYLLVTVDDNVKSMAKTLFDYGWIEDCKGGIVWKMDIDHSIPAGGALKNRMCDTCIYMKKGIYTLRYVTDESHSPGQWDDSPPSYPFYGIKLIYK